MKIEVISVKNFSDRTKHVELLEEQKAGLQMKTDILMRQNQQLIVNSKIYNISINKIIFRMNTND